MITTSRSCRGQDCHLKYEDLNIRALGGIIPEKKSPVASTSYSFKILYVDVCIVREVKNSLSLSPLCLMAGHGRLRGNFLSVSQGWGQGCSVLYVVAIIAYSRCLFIDLSVRDSYCSSDYILVLSRRSCQARASRNATLWRSSAKNLGTGKRPRLVKLTRNIIKRQSIFLWRHAGRSTGLLITGGVSAGTANVGSLPPLQLKGELFLEKELWVTSRSDACGLA